MRERLTDQRIVSASDILDAAVAAPPSSELPCGYTDRRSGEKAVSAVVCGEQRADCALHVLVAAARVPQKHVALRRWPVEHGLQ